MAQDNGNLRELTLRELTARIDELKDLMNERFSSSEKLIAANDRRYQERFISMDDKTSLALAGSEKAVNKAEAATEKRFDAVNEFRGTLRDQATTLFPRAEAETKFKSLGDKMDDLKNEIASLRESRSQATGKEAFQDKSALQNHWVIGIIISIFFSVCALGITLMGLMLRKP